MLVIAAMLVGAIVPAQTAINTRLRESVGSPIAGLRPVAWCICN
ncbi:MULTISPECIES: DMT family transporter [unclassified Corynebacterium]|nr:MULTISPECIES: DMT family transporter [unclassified Corynebacterium]MDK8476069.1 DMT family transporter [Corynebacterium sp. MSK310]MDK8672550.1 DMT family transporter [Corynebacterium sp. MSK189]MDK8735724.1 DMT family transporter [Corynebacterium sp. MSK306]